MNVKKIIFSLTFAIFASSYAFADEWKTCKVGNSLAPQRDLAIAFGKIDKSFSFFKKIDFASITIFFDGVTWRSTDLIQTGRAFFGDGKPYLGYANRNNTIIVQEFENSNVMIVSLRGDMDYTMFASCN